MLNRYRWLTLLLIFASLMASGCTPQPARAKPAPNPTQSLVEAKQAVIPAGEIGKASPIPGPTSPLADAAPTPIPDQKEPSSPLPAENQSGSSTIAFTLQTDIVGRRMVYVGVGGLIDGVVNPDLFVSPGASVQITLLNGDGIAHDLAIPDLKVKMPLITSIGKSTEVTFTVDGNQIGSHNYYCTQPGHRGAGQEGILIVAEP